jgi:hypothetical protein
MDEQEFDSLFSSRPFGTGDAVRLDARLRRSATLASLLWGRTPHDLQRRRLAPNPGIPPGYTLADFRALREHAHRISNVMTSERFAGLKGYSRAHEFTSPVIFVGTQRLTLWETRFELIRRAIEFLENR